MMTVISSIFGMIPLALGEGAGTELYRGMGTALIGGLGVSAIFTLFLVPILLSLLMDIGYHTHKDDLIKDSLVDSREVSTSGVPAELKT
jgi:HAE1 family hydrophobic/amphiphilic exporter-1